MANIIPEFLRGRTVNNRSSLNRFAICHEIPQGSTRSCLTIKNPYSGLELTRSWCQRHFQSNSAKIFSSMTTHFRAEATYQQCPCGHLIKLLVLTNNYFGQNSAKMILFWRPGAARGYRGIGSRDPLTNSAKWYSHWTFITCSLEVSSRTPHIAAMTHNYCTKGVDLQIIICNKRSQTPYFRSKPFKHIPIHPSYDWDE